MQMGITTANLTQAPISSRQLKDYTEVFKIVRLCKANNTVYIDYNMNFYLRPKLVIIERYLKKMFAKRDIYARKPFEIFKDFKRLFFKK
jgi:hypothetical protein